MHTLVEMALANALAATLLAGVAFSAGRLARRPALAHALWVLVLLRLLVPPVWGVPVPWLGTAAPETAPASVEKEEVALATQAGSEPVDESGDDLEPDGPSSFIPLEGAGTEGGRLAERVGSHSRSESATLDAPEQEETAQSSPTPTRSPAPPPPAAASGVPWHTVAGFAWLGGSLLVVGLVLSRAARFQRALRHAEPAPADIQSQADELAARLGLARAPGVWLVPGRVPPLLWAPFSSRRARLVLPKELLPHLDADQRAALLAHELAHLLRGDPWVRRVELLAVGLYWWFPLLGWFRRNLREAEELCCDARVVAALQARRAYATALVETVVFLDGPSPAPAPQLASGAGPVRQLRRRVSMIMRSTAPGRLSRAGLCGVLGFAALALAFGPAAGQAPRDPAPRNPAPENPPAPPGGVPGAPGGLRPAPTPRPEAPREDRDLQGAKDEVARLRAQLRNTLDQLRDAEDRLSRLERRPAPMGPVGGGPPGMRPPGGPMGMPPGANPGGVPGMPGRARPAPERDDRLRDMERQLDALRRDLERLRDQMRQAPEGGPRNPRPDPGIRPRNPRPDPSIRVRPGVPGGSDLLPGGLTPPTPPTVSPPAVPPAPALPPAPPSPTRESVRVEVPALGPVPVALDTGFPIAREREKAQLFNFWIGLFN